MLFTVAIDDVALLADAPGRNLTGMFPRLRFISLAPCDVAVPIIEALPRHLADRITALPTADQLRVGTQALLTDDPVSAAARFPSFDPSRIVTWATLGAQYEKWLEEQVVPVESTFSLYTPERLLPLDWVAPEYTFEIIGSCQAEALEKYNQWFPQFLPGKVSLFHTIQNVPVPTPYGEVRPDASLVVSAFRFMHPDQMDNIIFNSDPDAHFAESVDHLRRYLDSVKSERAGIPLFVQGFVEPLLHPEGVFFHDRSRSNLKMFVRGLNDEVVRWCEENRAYFVDVDAIANSAGKNFVDEGPLVYYGHRTPHDPTEVYKDITPRRNVSYYYVGILRWMYHQMVTISGASQVKAVITDLDDTLWDGLASDLVLGTMQGRPAGLVEALKILKRRGILIGIASKNDEEFIRSHWHELWTEPKDPFRDVVRMPFEIEEFDAVKIDFRPKSVTIGEMLAEFNLLPENVVFIDDNPLEREEVQAAFPTMRILGAEMHYVRSELLYSPFTNRHLRTAEDTYRSATVHQQAALQREIASGTADSFLASLGLVCSVHEIDELGSAAGQRAVQLINKTNQWNLNGERVSDSDVATRVAGGNRLVVAEVADRSNEYGLVAVAIVDPKSKVVDAMVVSCRVIGMGIDFALASWLDERFGTLSYRFVETDRNRAARDFGRSFGVTASGLTRLEDVIAPDHVLVKSA